MTILALWLPASAEAVDDSRTYWASAGDEPVLRVHNALGRFKVAKRGRRLSVVWNGKSLPAEDIRRRGRVYQVFDADGRQILLFGVFSGPGDGQLVYSPHLDPYAVQGMTGLDVVEKSYPGMRGLLPDWLPEKVVTVRKVAPGSVAGRVGLAPGQVLVACNGQRIEGESMLYGCLTPTTVRLTLEAFEPALRSPIEVTIELPAPAEWMSPRSAEEIFARALGR